MVGNPNHGKDGKFSSGPGGGGTKVVNYSKPQKGFAYDKTSPKGEPGFYKIGSDLDPNVKAKGHNAGKGNRKVASHIKKQATVMETVGRHMSIGANIGAAAGGTLGIVHGVMQGAKHGSAGAVLGGVIGSAVGAGRGALAGLAAGAATGTATGVAKKGYRAIKNRKKG
jgi:hypothetical protein